MDTLLTSLHVTMYGAPWVYLSGLRYRCKTGFCMFYPIILCLSTVAEVQSDSVVWKEAELVPTVVGNYVTESLTCDTGLVGSMLWTSVIAIFCLQPKNLWLTISELMVWFYLGWKLAVFCVECKYMNTILYTISDLNPLYLSFS